MNEFKIRSDVYAIRECETGRGFERSLLRSAGHARMAMSHAPMCACVPTHRPPPLGPSKGASASDLNRSPLLASFKSINRFFYACS